MKYIAIFLTVFLLTGCAGLADSTIPLQNGYRLDRLSAHVIQIYGEETIKSEKDNIVDFLYVPEKVTGVWWNDQYIAAKQLHLVPDKRGYEEPPEHTEAEDYSYWLIHMEEHKITGPMSFEEFEKETRLVMNEKIIFTPVEKLKRESE